MTKFSRVLNELLAEHGWTQSNLAEVSGLGQEKISRLVNSQTRAHRDDLTCLVNAFTDPSDRYRIARAHLSDELPEDILKTLEITVAFGAIRDAIPSFTGLPGHIESALRFLLQEYPDNPSIGDVFADLAAALGWQPGITPASLLPKKPPGKPGQYPPSKNE